MALNSNNLKAALETISAHLPEIEHELNSADSQLGDGDTGVMLSRVIKALNAAEINPDDLGASFTSYARATASATGSSLGTLIAIALTTFAKATKGRQEIAWLELSTILTLALENMSARGGAVLGDKTVLDSLNAIAIAIKDIDDPERISLVAVRAAQSALDEYLPRSNKVGRARMFAEASKGLHDPGMLAVL